MTSIELLSPARDLATGLAAISHGADAVYIGAPRFGARATAGESVENIRELCRQAHIFGVKVYVALNTILRDDELAEAQSLAWHLYEAGADALIVQDMAILQLSLPPIALHASTQMNNQTAEQVQWLASLGFRQTVLARELTLEEISAIHRAVPAMPLEAFVHGSICVAYNGQCYASQHCFQRSANRGECAQFCRLPFDLIESDGNVLQRQRHLLSLRDMNRTQSLEAMMDAGIRSFKIEGRLKDEAYVKNITAWYRRHIDDIIRRRPSDYCRASQGESTIRFSAPPTLSFNRGFTQYFLHGRTSDMANHLTPKSIGEPVGTVKGVGNGTITVTSEATFANGDGLCFFADDGTLQGFRVNKVDGHVLYPHIMPKALRRGMALRRTHSQAFETLMKGTTAERRIPLHWRVTLTPTLCRVEVGDIVVETAGTFAHAQRPQRDNIAQIFSRLGATPYRAETVDVLTPEGDIFVPASKLTAWRNEALKLLSPVKACEVHRPAPQASKPPYPSHLTYRANVANHKAREFYLQHGVKTVEWAMEVQRPQGERTLLMEMKYCLRHELGLCGKATKPWALRLADGRTFPLTFDCHACRMRLWAEQSAYNNVI